MVPSHLLSSQNWIRRWPYAFWLVILFVGLFAGIGITHFRSSQLDDAFITYRYARSLAAGLGFSYNPSEFVFGSTTPLYTLGLAAFGWAGLPIPTMSLIINWFCLVILAILVYWHTKQLSSRSSLQYMSMMMIVLLPGSYMVLGMETLLSAVLIYWALWAMDHARYSQAALLAGLATLCRYDGGLLVIVCAASELMHSRRFPWRTALISSLIVLPWLIAAQVMFGSILPNTALAKIGLADDNNNFIASFPSMITQGMIYKQESFIMWCMWGLFTAIAGFGAWRAWRSNHGRHMLIWMGFYMIAYMLLRLSHLTYWYYYVLMPGLIILFCVGIDGILQSRWFTISTPQQLLARLRIILLVPAGLVIALWFSGIFLFWRYADIDPVWNPRYRVYSQAAEWICTNSVADDSISVGEIGIIGWVCPRYIVDPYGLVTKEMVPYIRRNQRIVGVASFRPDFVITLHERSLLHVAEFPYTGDFSDTYTLAATFGAPDQLPIVVVYENANR